MDLDFILTSAGDCKQVSVLSVCRNTNFTVAKTPLANPAGRVILRSPGKGGPLIS